MIRLVDKVVSSPAEAVADIADGATIGIAGFGVAHRFPSSLITALRDQGATGLTVYCNGLGQPGHPTAHLLADSGQIAHLVTCFSARPGVVSEAVSCADFQAPDGTLVDLDFLVLPDGDEVKAVQAVVHSIDGEKRPYDLESR